MHEHSRQPFPSLSLREQNKKLRAEGHALLDQLEAACSRSVTELSNMKELLDE